MRFLLLFSLISFNLKAHWVAPRKHLKVMIIDTGVNRFIPQIHPYIQLYGQTDTWDLNNHGTHLAGIIATKACPGVEIIPCYGAWEFENSNKCFKLALKLDVDIINYSMEGPIFQNEEAKLLKKLERANIKLIACAGNEGLDLEKHPIYPASYPFRNITIVGALSIKGLEMPFSNYNKEGMVWELGEKVKSFGKYGQEMEMSGTSQATAIYTSKLVEKWCKGY